MRRAAAFALALAAPLALAQAPAQEGKDAASPGKAKAGAAQKAQKPQRAAKSGGTQAVPKAHAKPTPEQIRRFNELQKQQQSGKP